MKLYSTRGQSPVVELGEAVLRGLPPDNGLYMPEYIPTLDVSFFEDLPGMSLPDIGYSVCKALFQDYIPDVELRRIINAAINFPAPVVKLSEDTYVLELFHGPSLAFKDFGARFMAQLMGYFNRHEDEKLVILVATSGDTGGAVASGFVGVDGIEVCILYPSGKVSPLQEKQLTTHGKNITAIEVKGTFDDCQDLVKKAFLDPNLTNVLRLSSANSINIARLIPQSFYYFDAFRQLESREGDVWFSVPSGNFGNLTAGLFAKKMGLDITGFIAATNVNDVVPRYLDQGIYEPRPSIRTISNAMDVGNPSNFRRLEDLFCSTWNNFRDNMIGFSFSDSETKHKLSEVNNRYGYLLDPHGAVGMLAWDQFRQTDLGKNTTGVVLETAHPAKFKDDVESIIGEDITLPKSLMDIKDKEKVAYLMPPDYDSFSRYLLDRYN
ncbi:MAG: threonine synthase [Bacteroidetes bacterium]|nr:threonine synthase [Bacteroidota bacterium]